MLKPIVYGVVNATWPMIVISVVILISLRICYFIKFKGEKKFVFYKELLILSFIIYIMCLFQVVTMEDLSGIGTNNFVPFKEILRYNITSRLFYKNILGNIFLFLPYGFFASYLLQNRKYNISFILTIVASFSIELVQLLIGRVFDVDDIILNVCGGSIGFLLFYVIDVLWDKLPKFIRKEFVLNILSILILIFIIVILF